jgi:hypothetical protein
MKKNSIRHDVFSDRVIKSTPTTPTLPGTTGGCEGFPKAEGMPYPTVTTVKVKGQ